MRMNWDLINLSSWRFGGFYPLKNGYVEQKKYISLIFDRTFLDYSVKLLTSFLFSLVSACCFSHKFVAIQNWMLVPLYIWRLKSCFYLLDKDLISFRLKKKCTPNAHQRAFLLLIFNIWAEYFQILNIFLLDFHHIQINNIYVQVVARLKIFFFLSAQRILSIKK